MSLASEMLELMQAQGVEDETALIALAALAGPEELDRALLGDLPEHLDKPTPADEESPPAAYLSSIKVTGFRGIGESSELELTPGPGLIVVAGRNGSGKSSFAEALEVLLTGDSWRWKNKAAEWKQGWRNLHHTDGVKAEAEFVVEGQAGTTRAWREWDDTAKIAEDGATIVQAHGAKQTDLTEYGWASAIDLYRPMLSHSELSVVADNPSTLFDALSGVLGVDELEAAADLLRKRRLDAQSTLKNARKDLKNNLLPLLDEHDDPRAATAAAALSGRSWDLEQVESLVVGRADDEGTDTLRSWSQLVLPGIDQIFTLAASISEAHQELAAMEESEAGRAAKVADLLTMAMDHHTEHGDDDCPICGQGRLDADWLERTKEQVEQLKKAAGDYDKAVARSRQMFDEARQIVTVSLPGEVAGLDTTAVRQVVADWGQLPADPKEIAAHLEKLGGRVEAEMSQVVEKAEAVLADREDKWAPVGLALGRWTESARAGLADDARAATLKQAEDAVNEAMSEIRSRRFAPISTQAISLWQDLRLQSNVQLLDVELTGKGNRRRVDLKVTVDDTDGPALGVVSQGEINCLALSLFFPRATLPESPFKFIVIDDPVQAMDPARVDGLARVFSEIAKTHQLVVFTHDDRLPDSLRRLNLPHTVLQVLRRPNSKVEVRRSLDPVLQYFLDARAVSKDDDAPVGVVSRVVPVFCRSGIEAACTEAVRRRRLGRGESHNRVEVLLSQARTTMELAALALFDDETAGGKVLTEINRKWDRSAADAFNDARKGAHKGFSGNLDALIDQCQRLAEGLRAQ